VCPRRDAGTGKMEYRFERWESVETPEASELQQRMESEGYSVFRWSDSPGSCYPTHSHSTNQSHWVITGSIEFVIEGEKRITLMAGDRDFMPAGTKHSARVIGDEDAVYLIGSRV